MTNRGFALFFFVFVFLMGTGAAFAQSEAEQLYGQGVHLFNASRYAEAIDCFDQAETSDVQDPRIFFYRGLSHYRSGNEAAAIADYETGSKMELTVAGRSYSVPKALERIQGRDRTVIERYRRAAKRTWEAEQNVRRQDEFLAQKTENMQLFQEIYDAGDSAASKVAANINADSPLPFGAQSVQPFGAPASVTQATRRVTVAPTGLTEDNIFKDDIARVTVFEEPTPEVRPTTGRAFDPSESGVFDTGDDDPEFGFDGSVLTQQSGSAPGQAVGMGMLGSLFGDGGGSPFGDDGDDFEDDFSIPDDYVSPFEGGDDFEGDFSTTGDDVNPFGGDDDFEDGFPITMGGDDDGFPGSFSDFGSGNDSMFPGGGFSMGGDSPNVTVSFDSGTREGGRTFGKAFAGLFRKSDDATPSSTTPDLTAPALKPPVDNTGNKTDDEFDPFGGVWETDNEAEDVFTPFGGDDEADSETDNEADDEAEDVFDFFGGNTEADNESADDEFDPFGGLF